MAKIDFSKVEINLSQAMHQLFIKNLAAGKESAYRRAILFYGYHLPKPEPPDSVIEAINDWRVERALSETITEAEQNTLLPPQPIPPLPALDEAAAEAVIPEKKYEVSPLYILRKHLLWFIRKRVANIYKLLGTTKEEVIGLRKKKAHTPEEQKRILEILAKANEINGRLMKKLGIDSDEALIEKEVKKQKTKHFNIRENWLPL